MIGIVPLTIIAGAFLILGYAAGRVDGRRSARRYANTCARNCVDRMANGGTPCGLIGPRKGQP